MLIRLRSLAPLFVRSSAMIEFLDKNASRNKAALRDRVPGKVKRGGNGMCFASSSDGDGEIPWKINGQASIRLTNSDQRKPKTTSREINSVQEAFEESRIPLK